MKEAPKGPRLAGIYAPDSAGLTAVAGGEMSPAHSSESPTPFDILLLNSPTLQKITTGSLKSYEPLCCFGVITEILLAPRNTISSIYRQSADPAMAVSQVPQCLSQVGSYSGGKIRPGELEGSRCKMSATKRRIPLALNRGLDKIERYLRKKICSSKYTP